MDVKSENFEGLKNKELGENISKIIENNFKSELFNHLKKKLSFKNQTSHT